MESRLSQDPQSNRRREWGRTMKRIISDGH
jgi:hypothetical protein